VRMSSASRTGMLSLKDERLIDIKWKVGSLGLAEIRVVAATADAAPIRAGPQLHCTFLPMLFGGNYRLLLLPCIAYSVQKWSYSGGKRSRGTRRNMGWIGRGVDGSMK